jgi:hypothetical protein
MVRCFVVIAAILSSTALADYAEIGPVPLTWEQEPHAYISDEVVMKAKPVTHANGIEYRFECTDGPGHSSEWQTSATYNDTHLTPDTRYTYRVIARDQVSHTELTLSSRSVTVKTRSTGEQAVQGHMAAIDEAVRTGSLEMIPLMVNGDKDNRINIVVINRWENDRTPYNNADLREEFIADARYTLGAFKRGEEVSVPPYPSYANFFNVYAVWWPDMPKWNPQDRKTGMHWSDYNEIRARLFLPWQKEGTGWVTHMAMLNGFNGGGGAGRIIPQRVGDAMIVGNEIDSFIHEFNHTALSIPDEYTASGVWGRGTEGTTTTNFWQADKIKWRAWIEPGTLIPTPYSKQYHGKIGVFEGGVSRLAYLYRPTSRACIMGSGSFAGKQEHLCKICQQQATQAFYNWVDPIENPVPAVEALRVEGSKTIHFSVDRVKPQPDTQKTQWLLNDRVIAENVDEVDITTGSLSHYLVRFELVDETPFIRHDPPYAHFPRASRTWIVTNRYAQSDTSPLAIELTGRDLAFAGVNDGLISANISGGRPPFTYHWSDGASVKDRRGLVAGDYTLTVTDADFRTQSAEIRLTHQASVKPVFRSRRRTTGWTVSVEGLNESIQCQWSVGASGPRVSGLGDGTYVCTLTHPSGSQYTKTVSLVAPAQPFGVEIGRVLPSSGGQNNGLVAMQITGGLAPYTYVWSDGVTSTHAQRSFMAPGSYTVMVTDTNLSTIRAKVVVPSEPGFVVEDLQIEKAGSSHVRIKNPDSDYTYLWFEKDYPANVARFPQGFYTGQFIPGSGHPCKADAFVIQNKGGVFVDQRKDQTNLGHWVYVVLYVDGPDRMPATLSLRNTEAHVQGLTVLPEDPEESRGTTWSGDIVNGRMTLTGQGDRAGTLDLLFASHPDQRDEPLHTGSRYRPQTPGNVYVAVQKTDTRAISTNRSGFAIAKGDTPLAISLAPDQVTGAKLLLWLDASDTNGDGQVDTPAPRRGGLIGWQSRAGEVAFGDFVFYQPNRQNGKGVASWQTIWLQWLNQSVNNYQTIIMVRKEHDYSSERTCPWNELSPLIGIGAYGEQLMSHQVEDPIRTGAVYLNGKKVDPFKVALPTDFYLATYEFPEPIARGLRQTDGHWEGSLAECLVYDGKLNEAERRGVEEYLRRKWLAAVDLD